MAHCPPEKLTDLEPLFIELRSWPHLKEKKTGIFYFKGKGFLHFHLKGQHRWADIREGSDWGESVDIPLMPSNTDLYNLRQEITRRFEIAQQT